MKYPIILSLLTFVFSGSIFSGEADFKDRSLEMEFVRALMSTGDPAVSIETIEKMDLSGSSTIVSLEGIERCVSLKELNVRNNQIADLRPLAKLKHLRVLDLWGNKITSIKALENLTEIENLRLDFNQISDFSPLKKCSKLKVLGISGNRVPVAMDTFISCLGNPAALEELSVGNIKFTNIAAITALKNLRSLELNSLNLKDASFLRACINLRYLNLSVNALSDISFMRNLKNIEMLDLFSNTVSDLSPLNNLPRLTFLSIPENAVADLTALSTLPKLEVLRADTNCIESLEVLEKIKTLKKVEIGFNKLDLRDGKPDRKVVDELKSRGVVVFYEEGNLLE